MATSIYAFVKQKLMRHGAHKSHDGRIILENSRVFLAFVRLERTVRMNDFQAVQSAVGVIENCLFSLGKRHLIVFAYMYLKFSDGTPNYVKQAQMEDGSVHISSKYHRPVTAEERLIADWGRHMCNWLGRDLLRLVYLSNHERHHKNADIPSTFEASLPDHR